MKKITQVLLESMSISLIATVLSDREFLLKHDYQGILKDAQNQLETLKYLRKHYESNTKIGKPMLQLATQHRVLIEDILNKIFPENRTNCGVIQGQRYELLNNLIEKVQQLKEQENIPEVTQA